MPHASEAAFVRSFTRALSSKHSPWKIRAYGYEFCNSTTSRPDIVAVCACNEIFAIEAKLSRWRDAMHQAYRNTYFADRSYVLLPPAVAARAALNHEDFALRGVGICTLSSGRIKVIVNAPKLDPHNIWRREMAREHAFKRRRTRL